MSVTQTQTLPQRTIRPGRVYDHFYDPNYIVAAERDHARNTIQAQVDNTRIKCQPIYKTMFSELRHFPRAELKFDTTDPVPTFISKQWVDSSAKPVNVRSEDLVVSGANRYKYFKRPIIPFSQSMGMDVVLASARQDQRVNLLSSAQKENRERTSTPLHRTIQTQTDYRESEAQTDPYSPDYVVRPGTQPELLSLALLSYGCGLPAGLAEVEMIERARAKRAWEATLPVLDDASQLDKRQKMMEEQERKEWALRESEIEKVQEMRLQVLTKLLQQREQQHQELNTKRLDRLWTRKQEQKRDRITNIRTEHVRAIRKLTGKKSNVEGKLERRNIAQDYSDFGSQAFAPLTRVGLFIDRNADQYAVKSKFLSTYQGLLELENSLPDFVLHPIIKAPKQRATTSAGFVKRKFRQEKELEEIHKTIIENKAKAGQPPKPLRFLQKIEKPIPRPPTPTSEPISEETENRELAIIFLQKILRGRAIQNAMFEGKEERSELIRELRSTHALQAAEQNMMKDQMTATLAMQRQRELYEHKENVVDEEISNLEGETLGDALDFLSKELIRLQEERRIHAFSLLAERQRRIREAEESGLRQVEERQRREADEMFKQVVKVHQQTVDAYLEDIILNAIDITADEQARKEVQEMAEKINDAAYEMESRRTELESEEIVAELVHGFLLPEVQKQNMRERVANQQKKYLLAAHSEIKKDEETRSD